VINSQPAGHTEILRSFYEEAFEKLNTTWVVPPIEVSFYPYVGINHTIRVRDGKVFVRIGEICRDMPNPYQRALAYILVAKLLRKRVPKQANDSYSGYIKTTQMRERATESRRSNGRKVVTTHAGEVYDLDEIFERINAKYFAGTIEKPVLTWSARQTYRILGHHDSTHKTIVVSRSLDARDVPRYVVEYVLFHEMLHIHHPTKHVNGRRYNHTPAFRRDERKFSHYKEAEEWIEKSVRKLKRRAKRK
jgi:hypothetical protein